jgi:hypothetical protein
MFSAGSLDLCDLWTDGDQNPIENEPVFSTVPVMIFNGEFDPITPPNWGELAAQTLPKSRVVTFPGVGHGASFSGSACARQITVAFFDQPAAQPDTSCIGDVTPIHWITDDLTDSLADMEAKLENSGLWELQDHDPGMLRNYEYWEQIDDVGSLEITDYTASWLPFQDEMDWLDETFGDWGKYSVQNHCQSGGLSLYELEVGWYLDYPVRYWLDRRDPDRLRLVELWIPDYSYTSIDKHSAALFPELPHC